MSAQKEEVSATGRDGQVTRKVDNFFKGDRQPVSVLGKRPQSGVGRRVGNKRQSLDSRLRLSANLLGQQDGQQSTSDALNNTVVIDKSKFQTD